MQMYRDGKGRHTYSCAGKCFDGVLHLFTYSINIGIPHVSIHTVHHVIVLTVPPCGWQVVELKPGGAELAVTRGNCIEYIHLVAHHMLNVKLHRSFQVSVCSYSAANVDLSSHYQELYALRI